MDVGMVFGWILEGWGWGYGLGASGLMCGPLVGCCVCAVVGLQVL